MYKLIDARFERVERALSNLIESVTKHKPTITQTTVLDLADYELDQGLHDVQRHQRNHRRIQELHAATVALDTQIRSTLLSLASTRKELATQPFSDSFAASSSARRINPVPYAELLNYARRISKFTLPPPGVTNGIVLNPLLDQQQPQEGASGGAVPTPGPQARQAGNATATPNMAHSPLPAGAPPTPDLNGAPTPLPSQPAPSSQRLSTNMALPHDITEFLNPHSGLMFFPWPAEDKLRNGALASNQALVEQGIDPHGYDPAEEEARKRREDEGRRVQEEKERQEREEWEKTMWEERERMRREREAKTQTEGATRASPGATAGPPPGGDRKQFQFASFDDEEDDD